MSWASTFGKIGRFLWKHRRDITAGAVAIYEAIRNLGPKVLDWWHGKKIAVIGPTAVGKNSLYCRLKGKPIPDKHTQTKDPQRMPSFRYTKALPRGKKFSVSFKGCINVGGEAEQRARFWLDCCTGADVIFYMITLDHLRNRRYRKGSRVSGDLRWLATHMGEMKPNVRVHFLVNKIDLQLADGEGYEEFLAEIKPRLDEFEATAKKIFGGYQAQLTGVSPVSMKIDHIFALSFPKALEAVYEAVHQK